MKPRIGVSACLAGERVRYDGGHKLQAPLIDAFHNRVEWVPICPEVEIGLGVPRETIQLEAEGDEVRLVSIQVRRDLTQTMREWAGARLEALAEAGLDAYVFKARSPSCGLGSTPVAGRSETRDGLFAEAVRARFPALPLTDEEGLSTAGERDRFLRLAGSHRDLRQLFRQGWTRGEVIEFHTDRKLLLLAHSPDAYARLGALVGGQLASDCFQGEYTAAFLEAMRADRTPGRHANALSHAAGYFSQDLPAGERAALVAAIERIGAGDVRELAAVKATIRDHARNHGQDYLLSQIYLTECESL